MGHRDLTSPLKKRSKRSIDTERAGVADWWRARGLTAPAGPPATRAALASPPAPRPREFGGGESRGRGERQREVIYRPPESPRPSTPTRRMAQAAGEKQTPPEACGQVTGQKRWRRCRCHGVPLAMPQSPSTIAVSTAPQKKKRELSE